MAYIGPYWPMLNHVSPCWLMLPILLGVKVATKFALGFFAANCYIDSNTGWHLWPNIESLMFVVTFGSTLLCWYAWILVLAMIDIRPEEKKTCI